MHLYRLIKELYHFNFLDLARFIFILNVDISKFLQFRVWIYVTSFGTLIYEVRFIIFKDENKNVKLDE